MSKKNKTSSPSGKKPIEQYSYKDNQRANNPPVGLVAPDTYKDIRKKKRQSPFYLIEADKNKCIAVKTVDDSGIESLKIVALYVMKKA